MLAVKAALVQYLIDQNMSADKTDSPSNASQTADDEAPDDEPHSCPQVYTENAEAEETEEGSLGMEDDSETQTKSGSHAMKVLTRFMCKFCGCQFMCRADMDDHASGHDDEKPPLKCGVCGKTYNTRSKLQRHVRVHSGERPFPCEVCGKRFPRSDHVKQHMRVHAKYPSEVQSAPNPVGLTENKSYCRLCGVKFEQKSELNQHLLTHGFNKLYSCIYCGEVFESNEKLKAHKLTHENQYEEYLPVLSIPDLSATKSNEIIKTSGGAKRRKVGRPRGSKSSNASKRRKEAARLGFAKFKIARKSGSEDWQAVKAVLKMEVGEEGSSTEKSDQTQDKPMPILERILKEGSKRILKSEDEDTVENGSSENKLEEASEGPQMAISACYSLAEGQDNSDIPDIEEIRASTLTDGSNMILVPMSSEGDPEASETSDDEDEEKDKEQDVTGAQSASSQKTTVCAVSGNSISLDGETVALASQTFVSRANLVPSTATATATLMAIQQQVYPQIATASSCSATSSTRPTISLLPNVLAFRTHPILTTPTLNLTSTAVHPTAANIYNTGSLYNPLGNFTTAGQVFQRSVAPGCLTENFPLGRKMMRCQYCCIWFEDSALGLLHQSLHSADEMDPFTCKKCLKRLGNRLEFTAHIIWHLDPTMEDGAVV